MRHRFSYLVLLLLGLCRCFCCIDAAIVDNSYGHYRLPTSIRPDHYELKVITHLENPLNLTFYGDVTIRFEVLQDTTNITLHSQDLSVDESHITINSCDDGKRIECVLSVNQVPEHSYFIIQLCQTLRKGRSYKLELHFSSVLNDKLYGYYHSSYNVKANNETRWLSITHFEPIQARTAFPCFDEPEYKAKFVIWLGHHKSLTALSNMPLEKQVPLNGTTDFIWSIFEESVRMSTYLIAYTVNDFAHKKAESNDNIVFSMWARPEVIDEVNYAGEIGPKILKYYEDIFGIPFPLRKIDLIAIPDFAAAAMENWGLITYRETDLLFAPHVSSNSNKMNVAETMAHELAHQWFGNLVTMKWWSDLWLNEGFATYIASLGVQHVHPEWNFYDKNSFENLLEILITDAQYSTHPISQPITDISQIAETFDSISYNKGSAVLRMLHMVLENDAFFEGVHDYLKRYQYANAEQYDLLAVFTEKAHYYNRLNQNYEIKAIMDSWTLQAGYPLVKVKRDYKTGSVIISQHAILPGNKRNCWWVPLSYTTASAMNFNNTTPQNWLECNQSGRGKNLHIEKFANNNEWVLLNIQLSGVYRVMYDLENWRLLNMALKSKEFTKIHVMNRAQLVDDVIWMAWSGYHKYDITLDILEYLIQEREYLPWKSALYGLSNVYKLLSTPQVDYELLKRYILYVITPVYFYLGGINPTSVEDSSDEASLHRSLIASWACRLHMEDCVHNCIKYFQQWQLSNDPNTDNKIPADIRFIVYCTAIRHGSEEDWKFLWQRYMDSNVATEIVHIIYGLSCSHNATTLRNYLEMAYKKNSLIRAQDTTFVFSYIAMNKIGFPIAKQYFIDNIAKINDFYGPYSDELGNLLTNLAIFISSSEDRTKLKLLIESNKDYFKNYEYSVQSAFESMYHNIQWIEHNLRYINSLLQLRFNASTNGL